MTTSSTARWTVWGTCRDPVVTRWADLVFRQTGQPDASPRPFVMIARPGQFDEVDVVAGDVVPAVGDVLIPEWMTGAGEIGPGDTIDVEPDPRFSGGATAEPVELLVAGMYDDDPDPTRARLLVQLARAAPLQLVRRPAAPVDAGAGGDVRPARCDGLGPDLGRRPRPDELRLDEAESSSIS